MGDDELNFTEEESRDWESDPRNQAQQPAMIARPLAVFFLLVAAALIIVWLASRANVESRPPALNAQPDTQSLQVQPGSNVMAVRLAVREISTSKGGGIPCRQSNLSTS